MSLWGKKDSVNLSGTISLVYNGPTKIITGDETLFTTEVSVGDIITGAITLDAEEQGPEGGAILPFLFRVSKINSNTSLTYSEIFYKTIEVNDGWSIEDETVKSEITAQTSSYPKYLTLDYVSENISLVSGEDLQDEDYGPDLRENGVRASGWVKSIELTNGRKRSETLVAMKDKI